MYVCTIPSSVLNWIILSFSSRRSFNLSSELARVRFDLSLFDQFCHNGLWSWSRRDSCARGWTWQYYPLNAFESFIHIPPTIITPIVLHRHVFIVFFFCSCPFSDVLSPPTHYTITYRGHPCRRFFVVVTYTFLCPPLYILSTPTAVSIYKNWTALHRLTFSINCHVFTDIVTTILHSFYHREYVW